MTSSVNPIRVVGVDPGVAGALAYYSPTENIMEVWDMPTAQLSVSKRKATRIVPELLLQNVKQCVARGPCNVYIEQVAAMPAQGRTSIFTFGQALGLVHGLFVAQGMPVHLIAPALWKRTVKLRTGAGKDDSRALACQLFPRFAERFSRVKDHNRADAVLIAYAASLLENRT